MTIIKCDLCGKNLCANEKYNVLTIDPAFTPYSPDTIGKLSIGSTGLSITDMSTKKLDIWIECSRPFNPNNYGKGE